MDAYRSIDRNKNNKRLNKYKFILKKYIKPIGTHR